MTDIRWSPDGLGAENTSRGTLVIVERSQGGWLIGPVDSPGFFDTRFTSVEEARAYIEARFQPVG